MNHLHLLFILITFGCNSKSDDAGPKILTPKTENQLLFEKLTLNQTYSSTKDLGKPEYPCDATEEFQYTKISTCPSLIIYQKTQIQGCWGGSGYGAWEKSNPEIGYVTSKENVMLGIADKAPILIKNPKHMCPDILVSIDGMNFNRIYHETGYAKYEYNPDDNSFSAVRPKITEFRKNGSLKQ